MVRAAFLLLLSIAVTAPAAMGDQLTIHFIRSPAGMDWETPQSVAYSVLINTGATYLGKRHSIGHVQTQVNCEGSDGLPPFRQGTGMSEKSADQERELVLRQKIGLSVLFFNFPGHLEKNEEVDEDLRRSYLANTVNYVSFDISPSTCRRIQQYVTAYEARGYWHNYGLPNRPLWGEGSGCSAFGASFVQVAGLMLPDFHTHWTRFRRVPKKYMGGWLNPGKKVNVFRLAATYSARWSESDEAHREIFFWDPDMMYRWVRYASSEIAAGRADLGYPATLERQGRAYGIRLDMREVPTPQGPIWRMEEPEAPEVVAIRRELSLEAEARMDAFDSKKL